jgi:hypothetical protein
MSISQVKPRKRTWREAEDNEEEDNAVRRDGAMSSRTGEELKENDEDDAMKVDGKARVEEQVKWPLTDECHHYSRLKEVPWDIQK